MNEATSETMWQTHNHTTNSWPMWQTCKQYGKSHNQYQRSIANSELMRQTHNQHGKLITKVAKLITGLGVSWIWYVIHVIHTLFAMRQMEQVSICDMSLAQLTLHSHNQSGNSYTLMSWKSFSNRLQLDFVWWVICVAHVPPPPRFYYTDAYKPIVIRPTSGEGVVGGEESDSPHKTRVLWKLDVLVAWLFS